MTAKFKDKYISVLGDSISTLIGYLPDGYPSFYDATVRSWTGVALPADTWWGAVIEGLSAKLLVNNSWSGSFVCCPPYSEIESHASSDTRCGGLDRDGIMPDFIFVYMGTNDRGRGFPLTAEDKRDPSVIENAYSAMLEKLRKNYPDAEIFCLTLPETSCLYDDYYSFPKMWHGIPAESYSELIAKTAKNHGADVIDLAKLSPPVETIDGLHPNYRGMMTIAETVLKELDRENL